MIGFTYRRFRRKFRWIARLVGVFCGFFAYEYLSANPHTEVLGAADPYAGAVVGYFIGSWLVVFAFVWVVKSIFGMIGRLIP